jgi:hypothetical protein
VLRRQRPDQRLRPVDQLLAEALDQQDRRTGFRPANFEM